MEFKFGVRVVRDGEDYIIDDFKTLKEAGEFVEGETEADVLVNDVVVYSFKDEDEIDDTPDFEDEDENLVDVDVDVDVECDSDGYNA